MIRRYILRARSIDGPVFSTRYGWTGSRLEAELLTLREAQARVSDQIARNRRLDLDDGIGRLSIVLASAFIERNRT